MNFFCEVHKSSVQYVLYNTKGKHAERKYETKDQSNNPKTDFKHHKSMTLKRTWICRGLNVRLCQGPHMQRGHPPWLQIP